jgi:hypothetical protein
MGLLDIGQRSRLCTRRTNCLRGFEAVPKPGLTIVRVPIFAGNYTKPPMADLEAAYDPTTSLCSLSDAQQDMVLVEL